MRLFLASSVTLGGISFFLFLVLFLITYFGGFESVPLWVTILGIIGINLVLWLISPRFSDIMYKWFYKLEWISQETFHERAPVSAKLVERICASYDITIPKIGIIDDKNPTAFTYGSGPWNGRIVISEGMFHYLDEEELASVIAHEMGHIKHWDVAIMTLASTLIQIIYQLYVRSSKMSKKGNKKKNPFGAIAAVTYVVYFLSKYLLLYLSRVREYYADEFAAKETDGNLLSSALVKVAYGILSTEGDSKLIAGTQHLGLTNASQGKGLAQIYSGEGEFDRNKLSHTILYDIKNPWASLLELTSTHPVTGKRIKALMAHSAHPVVDFTYIETSTHVDTKKMWKVFWADIMSITLPTIAACVAVFYVIFSTSFATEFAFIGGLLVVGGVYYLAKNVRKFGDADIKKSNTFDLMSDLYASPLRGQAVEMEGEVVGKGTPGYVLSEDVVLEDDTGIMYLDYQSIIPLIGNLRFSLTKVKKLIGKKVKATGWFFRNQKSYVVLKDVESDGDSIGSYAMHRGYIIPVVAIIAGAFLLFGVSYLGIM